MIEQEDGTTVLKLGSEVRACLTEPDILVPDG